MPKLLKLSVVALCLSAAAFAATIPDFSGDYAAQHRKNGKIVLRVVQTESAIEVTRLEGEKPVTNRFPLGKPWPAALVFDGSEGDYTTETGLRGRCKGQLKNDTLVLESFVVDLPDPVGRPVHFFTIEQWRLSADTKTLSIKTEIKSPEWPPAMTAAAFPNNPHTETYQRSEKP